MGIYYIKCCEFDLVRDRRDHFLTTMLFKAIHGIAPIYLSDRLVMNFYVNDYDTGGSDMG